MLLPGADTDGLSCLQALDDPRAACLCQPLCYRYTVTWSHDSHAPPQLAANPVLSL